MCTISFHPLQKNIISLQYASSTLTVCSERTQVSSRDIVAGLFSNSNRINYRSFHSSSPPYLWGSNAGPINVGGVVGTVLGAICTFVLADFAITRLAKHESHGCAELEDRLAIAFPGLFLATTGLWMPGFCAQNPSPKAWVCLFRSWPWNAHLWFNASSIYRVCICKNTPELSQKCKMTSKLQIWIKLCLSVLRRYMDRKGRPYPTKNQNRKYAYFPSRSLDTTDPIGRLRDGKYAYFRFWSNSRRTLPLQGIVTFGVFGGLMDIFSLLVIPQILWSKRTRIATEKWLPEHSDYLLGTADCFAGKVHSLSTEV
jgi:hypothetical protein